MMPFNVTGVYIAGGTTEKFPSVGVGRQPIGGWEKERENSGTPPKPRATATVPHLQALLPGVVASTD
jgi:hypothetical protein